MNAKPVYHLIQLAQSGDNAAKEQLIRENSNLVYSIAKRFLASGREFEDLLQVGYIGLFKSIEKFDFNYQVSFSTYAVPMIMGEIRRFLRDDSPLKISRTLKERALLIQKKREQLLQKHGQEPTLNQLADELSLSIEAVIAATEATQAPLSLNQPVSEKNGDTFCLGDVVVDDIHSNEKIINNIEINNLLDSLTPRLAELLRMRYIEDKTQVEVAKIMQLSQVQVSRLEKQALLKLRESII